MKAESASLTGEERRRMTVSTPNKHCKLLFARLLQANRDLKRGACVMRTLCHRVALARFCAVSLHV